MKKNGSQFRKILGVAVLAVAVLGITAPAHAQYCYCIGTRLSCMGSVGKIASRKPSCSNARSARKNWIKVPVGTVEGKTVYKLVRNKK